eukprot:403337167
MNMSMMLSSTTDHLLKKTLFEKFSQQQYYNQPILNPNDPRCNPDDYMKECTEKIPLEDIYKFVTTCYQNELMQFMPVLFEIVAPRVITRFKENKYLIQVWNKSKKKVYEEAIPELFKYWNVCSEYLIIMKEDKSEEGTLTGTFTLKIYDFLRGSTTWFELKNIKLEDEIKRIAFHEDILYMASDKKIYISAIQHMIPNETVVPFEEMKIRTIDPELRILDFVVFNLKTFDNQLTIAMENHNNQIEYNRLKVSNVASDDEFTYHFNQHREVKPSKKYFDDPIAKHIYCVTDYPYSVSIRESGKFELYWNMNTIEIIDNEYIEECMMSLSSFYFKMQDGRYLKLDHCNSPAATYSSAYQIDPSEYDYQKVYMQRVQNYVKIFSGFSFSVVNGNNGCVITNNDFSSFYDLSNMKWYSHVEWETEISSLFRIKKEKGYGGSAGVICKNGAIYLGASDYRDFTGFVPTKWRDHKIEETVIRTSDDIENQLTVFITVQSGEKGSEKYKLKYLFRTKLYDFDLIPESSNANLHVVTIQDRDDNTEYVIVDGKTMYLFQIQVNDEDEATFKQLRKLENIEFSDILHSAATHDISKYLTVLDQNNLYFFDFTLANPMKKYENVNGVSMQNFTSQINYVICQQKTGTKLNKGGLKCFSNALLREQQKLVLMELSDVSVGALGQFDYGFSTMRLGIIESMVNLLVMPLMHRNVSKFLGISAVEDYICVKQIGDKFIGLQNNGRLVTWSIPTGKILNIHNIEDIDFSKYDVKTKYRTGAVLLVTKESYPDIDQEHFFEPHQLTRSTKNLTPFVLFVEKTIKRWKYIEIKSETEVTTHLEFYHPSYPKEWIFINQDKTKMIMSGSDYQTFIFNVIPDPVLQKREGDANVVRWQLIRKIQDYPTNFSSDYHSQEFFTPNFTRYIIYNEGENQFLIKDTYTEQILYYIPKELMTVEADRKPEHVINRIKFLNERILKIISEDGVEKLLDMDDGFKDLSYNFRPLFNEIDGKEYMKNAYYFLRSKLTLQQSLLRLQIKYQDYKSAYYLDEKRDITQLYEEILTYDKHHFQAELSFALVDWYIIELIRKGKLQVEDVHQDQLKQLIFNILPGGNTILHRLCDREEQLMKLMQIAHPDEKSIKYHVPFIPNVLGDTPLHRCIHKSDFKSIDIILKYLKNYHLDHHSRGIEDLFPVFIQQDLPGFLEYVDSRILETEQSVKISRGCLKEDYPEILTANLWFNQQELYSKILQPKPVENRIKCSFLDFTSIFHQTHDKFLDLFSALAETDNPEYFNKKVVQKLIEFNYPLVKEYLLKKLFYPFCVFLVIYQFFIFEVNEKRESEAFYGTIFYPVLAVVVLFATYFLSNEMVQLRNNGLEYFTDVWNYIDIIPPVGIFTISVMILMGANGVEINIHYQRSLIAIISFFMWMKLLYFLRIFRSTGYLIGMILEVIKDMRFFFVVLLITIIAFGSAFLTLSLGNEEANQFTNSNVDAIIFTYRMILGDFDTEAFGEVATPTVWILFLLCTLFNMIVMLNLLISIISETFAKVTGLADQKIYQEMASIIAENSYLIPDDRKENYANKNEYLMIIEDLENLEEQQEQDSNAQILKSLEELKKIMLEKK